MSKKYRFFKNRKTRNHPSIEADSIEIENYLNNKKVSVKPTKFGLWSDWPIALTTNIKTKQKISAI